VAGLFLVGFITLVFGFIGILWGIEDDTAMSLIASGTELSLAIGIIFLVLTVSAIKIGNAFAAALFGFIAASLVATSYALVAQAPTMMFIIAFIYLIFAIIAFMIGAPKLLAILLIVVALLYLFVGLFIGDVFYAGEDGITFAYIFGVVGVLAGVLATYMALALSTQKLPVF
jgi:hypothetical protein